MKQCATGAVLFSRFPSSSSFASSRLSPAPLSPLLLVAAAALSAAAGDDHVFQGVRRVNTGSKQSETCASAHSLILGPAFNKSTSPPFASANPSPCHVWILQRSPDLGQPLGTTTTITAPAPSRPLHFSVNQAKKPKNRQVTAIFKRNKIMQKCTSKGHK